MTKIVFNNTNTNGYVQGMRPDLPAHSKLRRNEERKECPYTDQFENCSEPAYDFRESDDRYRSSSDRALPRRNVSADSKRMMRTQHPANDRKRNTGLSEMIKGVPLWSVSAINSSMGLMTLFIPCLILSLNAGISDTSGYNLELLSLLLSDNSDIIAKFTAAQPWKLLVPTVISAIMTAYFLLMRERAFDTVYVPAAAGICSLVMSVMFFIDVENSMHNIFINVECGLGVYVSMASSLVLVILSIAAAVLSMMRNKKSGAALPRY